MSLVADCRMRNLEKFVTKKKEKKNKISKNCSITCISMTSIGLGFHSAFVAYMCFLKWFSIA